MGRHWTSRLCRIVPLSKPRQCARRTVRGWTSLCRVNPPSASRSRRSQHLATWGSLGPSTRTANGFPLPGSQWPTGTLPGLPVPSGARCTASTPRPSGSEVSPGLADADQARDLRISPQKDVLPGYRDRRWLSYRRRLGAERGVCVRPRSPVRNSPRANEPPTVSSPWAVRLVGRVAPPVVDGASGDRVACGDFKPPARIRPTKKPVHTLGLFMADGSLVSCQPNVECSRPANHAVYSQ